MGGRSPRFLCYADGRSDDEQVGLPPLPNTSARNEYNPVGEGGASASAQELHPHQGPLLLRAVLITYRGLPLFNLSDCSEKVKQTEITREAGG